MKKSFFTLIELLIVVAIIGVLVTLLLPSLANSREKAKMVVCLSNNRQMATAYTAYAVASNNFAITHMWYRDMVGYNAVRYPTSLLKEKERPINKYAHPKIGVCPSDKGKVGDVGKTEFGQFGSSYYVNYATGTSVGKTTNIKNASGVWWSGNKGIMLQTFDRPDKKIVFHVANLNNTVNWNDASGQAKWHDQKNPREPVSFIDGHGEYFHFFWKKNSIAAPSFTNSDAQIKGIGYY